MSKKKEFDGSIENQLNEDLKIEDFEDSKTIEALDKLRNKLNEDLKFDELQIVEKMQRLPHLSSNWLYIYSALSSKLEQHERKLKNVYNLSYGRIKNGSNFKIDTSQITRVIEGEQEYLAILKVRDHYKIVSKFAEEGYKKINNLSFIIQGITEYKKFMNGYK
jgi:hypothetical protein